jgi:hypothetical protein
MMSVPPALAGGWDRAFDISVRTRPLSQAVLTKPLGPPLPQAVLTKTRPRLRPRPRRLQILLSSRSALSVSIP